MQNPVKYQEGAFEKIAAFNCYFHKKTPFKIFECLSFEYASDKKAWKNNLIACYKPVIQRIFKVSHHRENMPILIKSLFLSP